jgi:hypothetical protein
MNYTLIILGIILVVILYVLYTVISEKGVSVTKKLYLKEANSSIAMKDLSNPVSVRYSYNLWVYVNALTNGAPINNIFSIKSATATPQSFFELNLTSDAKLKYKITTVASGGESMVDNEAMSNFPLQKWVYISISVDTNIVDIYIDGKLIRSQKVDRIQPPTKECSVMYPSNFDAYIAKFDRFDKPVDPETVWNAYMAGNGGSYFTSLFSSYGANLTLTKDSLDLRKFTMF